MPELIFVKISVNKIKKERMFKGKQNTYLDCALMPNRNGTDEYGNDYFIVQSVTKGERAQGVKGDIIGNAKIHRKRGMESRQPAPKSTPPPDDGPPESDDVSF